MAAPASTYLNIVDSGAVTIANARVLRRIVVNTGVAGGTVTVTDTDTNPIAIIDAASPDIGRQYDAQVNGLIVNPSDDALDVTVTYD